MKRLIDGLSDLLNDCICIDEHLFYSMFLTGRFLFIKLLLLWWVSCWVSALLLCEALLQLILERSVYADKCKMMQYGVRVGFLTEYVVNVCDLNCYLLWL